MKCIWKPYFSLGIISALLHIVFSKEDQGGGKGIYKGIVLVKVDN